MNLFIKIAIYIVLSAAVLSSLFWVFLSFTWWKLEKNRIKRLENNEI